ncbi:MAG: alpha-galactosidase [Clostridia bacterium]|nr:alpha-galactosidase [Clostridia bacterium]
MSVSVDLKKGPAFCLRTRHTCYTMHVEQGKFLLHDAYVPSRKGVAEAKQPPYRSFSPYRTDAGPELSADIVLSEFPAFGSGDFRGDAVRVRNPEGNETTCFLYRGYRVLDGKPQGEGLPCARPLPGCRTLVLTLRDEHTGVEADLFYTAYEDTDVLIRSVRLRNTGKEAVRIENLKSLSLDLYPAGNWDVLDLYGAHCAERMTERLPLGHARVVMASSRGASSHFMNPFFVLCDRRATEDRGLVYAFNLIYSGNFENTVEQDQNGVVRVRSGLHPDHFSWLLEPGQSFRAPEAVLTCSREGLGRMSRNMHAFVRRAVLRPCPTDRHPVVLNTWEGTFFDVSSAVVREYAADASRLGFDMLVMDDGWFGKRVNDRAGLGDWTPNPGRFPEGLPEFVRAVKADGIRFGIWIEPEMVNPDSDLYRAHPDWVIASPGYMRSESRNQLVLDFTNPAVVQNLKEQFEKTFRDVPLDYIKWDFNRHLSEVGSSCLPPERQGETAHRYMLGVYGLYDWFARTYPGVMIENCSGGGGRYDLGMMAYSSQIWTSDNTEPSDRVFIQYGSSLGYPAEVMSCHVSNHGGAIEKERNREFMFAVATQGVLGYEFSLKNVSMEAKEAIAGQIRRYRTFAHLVEEGDLYRLSDPHATGRSVFYYAGQGQKEILFTYLQPAPLAGRETRYRIHRALPGKTYTDLFTGKKYTGAELREGIRVRPDPDSFSFLQMYLRAEEE